MIKLFTSLLILIYLASCATNFEGIQFQRNASDSESSIARTFDKNYILDQEKTVFVGQPMIRIKDYFTSTASGKRLKVIKDDKAPMNVGKLFNICGETEEGMLVTQIALVPERYECDIDATQKGFFKFGILVNKNNLMAVQTWSRIHSHDQNEMQKNTGELSLYLWDMAFERLQDKTIDTSRGYENFEIIYSGISNQNTLRTLYREYSSSDLARSDFFQELTYPIDKDIIRFRDIEIELINIENDRITFKVIEDNRK